MDDLDSDVRPCRRAGCGHEGRVHSRWKVATYCGTTGCTCGEWLPPRSVNTGFIGIVTLIEGEKGGIMRYWAITRWRLTVLRASLTSLSSYPHPHRPVRIPAGDGYLCTRCGSRNARVQRKGSKRAEALRRRFA